ncbi:NHL domain-containing protein [Thioalkalivibrio paradoxus]|uniref:NHL domain-containing protein n=1 Tax=Thioalkalivibrio paradoxus TaxID=108010 RepID=UPI00022C3E7A|nr:RHS repeat-associated core domain-containing protein [Thioalkalivibrio paradoxus]
MEGTNRAGTRGQKKTSAGQSDGNRGPARRRGWRSAVHALALLLLIPAWTVGTQGNEDSDPIGAGVQEEDRATTPGASLWVGATGGALLVDAVDGAILFSDYGTGELNAVAADLRRGTAWAYGRGSLYALDPGGQVSMTIPVDHGGRGNSNPVHLDLAIDEASGDIWLARLGSLTVFDWRGVQLLHHPLAQPLRAMALDSGRRTAWVAGPDRLSAWTLQGEPAGEMLLGEGFDARTIAFDASLDAVWVGGAGGLRRYAIDGTLQFTQEGSDIRLITADQAGALWATDGTWLWLLDASGHEHFALQPLYGTETVQALAVDPADGSAWVAGASTLQRISAHGDWGVSLDLRTHPSFRGRVWALSAYADVTPPEIAIVAPAENSFENTARPPIVLRYSDVGSGVDPDSLALTVDHKNLPVSCAHAADGAECVPESTVHEGEVTLRAVVADRAGNVSAFAERRFTVDTIPPVITLTSPEPGGFTNQVQTRLHGLVSEPVELTIEGEAVALGLEHRFDHPVELVEGPNTLSFVAVDRAGNVGELQATIVLDTVPPLPVEADQVRVGDVSAGQVSVTGGVGSAEADARIHLQNTHTGAVASSPVAADGSFALIVDASPDESLELVVVDRAGNRSTPVVLDVPGATGIDQGPLPPDPATVAPPLDEGGVPELLVATAFLYTGDNPIQRGVVPGTITEHRAAVLRGRVTARDGQPLAGVRITVKDHDDLGHTLSRLDGGFDMAVNGGGHLAVRYDKPGYLPVQRQVRVPWLDYVWAPDVVLIPLDPAVSSIDLAADVPVQAARGSVVSDTDGTRQATILFPQGTTAELRFADGSSLPITRMSVRATEYTVGESGAAAMPGELPPTSGYTYAVELSVDEAMTAGATEVRFDRPVPVYVENFLDFPVGGIVPAGWYDRDKAAWIASDNGRIIRVLSVEGGAAVLDVTGSGAAATESELAALAIDAHERRALADLYAPGQSLWRVPTEHFTPWDYNWPYGPPPDAEPPRVPEPEIDEREDEPDCRSGSIIECQNQVLGQSVPVAGTPFSLNYRSDRVPGRQAARSLRIPLSGSQVPASLQRIDLQIEVAGRRFHQSFAGHPNQVHTFVWDGKDAFGRELPSAQTATVRVGYVYRAVYYAPANFSRSFAATGLGILSGDRRRHEITLWRESRPMLGAVDARVLGLGGWSLNAHHMYSAPDAVLYKGDGTRRSAKDVGALITTVAGNGNGTNTGDGGPALEAGINGPYDVAIAPDGSIFLAAGDRVRKVDVRGVISTVPGTAGNSGILNVAVDAGGSVFFTRRNGGPRIFRANPDGTVHHVAGNGSSTFAGDGGPAVNASFIDPRGIAVGADGSLYVGDFRTHRVRRIGPDGIIRTVAGNGGSGIGGIGGPAVQARIDRIYDVAVSPEGDLYIDSHNYTVFRVGPDGIIHRAAGRVCNGFSGDGGDATLACMGRVSAVTAASDGTIAIADIIDNRRIRLVTPDGIIRTVAGTGQSGFTGDGGLAERATIGGTEISFGPDGSLYLADSSNRRVRRIASSLGGTVGGARMVASRDGSEHYVFDHSGRHLRTVDNVTGALRYVFGYDVRGLLVQIEDGDGNRTRIERDATGDVVAIVGPDGQRTVVSVGAHGYLASVTNPMGETSHFAYGAGGLLTGLTDPRGFQSAYTYDALGRLAGTGDPAGGGWNITRGAIANGYEVGMTSAEGRATRYRVEQTPTGNRFRENLLPDGTRETLALNTGGRRIFTAADGTLAEILKGPDPRFGMSSPVPSSVTLRTPSGRVQQTTTQRTAMLGQAGDPLSHSELVEIVTSNGRMTQARFSAADRTWLITSPQGRQRSIELDARSRIQRDTIAGLAPVAYERDARGRLTRIIQGAAGDRVHALSYNESGQVATVSDPLSRTRGYAYDSAGRIVRETLPDGREIGYAYDPAGNLAALVPPGREAHLFEYTQVNLEQRYLPPALPGVDTITRYQYNRDRQLTAIERPDGQALRFFYDAGGRPDSLQVSTGEYRFGFHPETGQLASIDSPTGIGLAYSWDGFLPLSETWAGAVNGSVSQSYDHNFWVTQRSVNGQGIAYQHDSDGLLIGAGDLSLARDPGNGRVIGSSLGLVSTVLDYNAFGEIVSIRAAGATGVLAEFGYSRDAVGRVIEETALIEGGLTRTSYSYDVAGRLATVSRDGTAVTYTYDANGNRTHVNGLQAAVYDGQDRMLAYGQAQFEYSENGELASRTDGGVETRYVYDEVGNLQQVHLPGDLRIEYLTDGRNRRVGKRVNGALVQGFLYRDQLNPIAELDGSGQVVSRFVYAEHAHVPDFMIRDDATYRILSDQLGSPRLVVNVGTGEVVQRIDYDAWGNVLQDTNPGFQPFGFAGGLLDQHTNLVRFGARDYDPSTGRWTAKDPIRFAGGDPNLYGYVLNDPLNWLDPHGLWSVSLNAFAGIGGGVIFGRNDTGTWFIGGQLGVGIGGGGALDPFDQGPTGGARTDGPYGAACSTLKPPSTGFSAGGSIGIGGSFGGSNFTYGGGGGYNFDGTGSSYGGQVGLNSSLNPIHRRGLGLSVGAAGVINVIGWW